MNILILSQRVPYPPNKGEKLRTFFQIKHLLENGHAVSVLTPAHSTDDLKLIRQFESQYDIPVVYHQPGAAWPRLLAGLLSFKSLSVCNFYCRQLQNKLDHLLETTQVDIILCTSSSMAEYVFRSGYLRTQDQNNTPLLLMDFMDLDSDKWQQYAEKSTWPMKWIYLREASILARYESRVQQTFNHCFFISQNEVDLFNKRNGISPNVHVLGNGIDTSEFYPADNPPENSDPVFIFTGVMDYKPNIDAVQWFVENAWGLIKHNYPDARFIIAGMNPVQSIEKMKNTPGIEVTGFVDDILTYYHQSDYFVAPFTIARGVQNKVLQAFACGLPVISSAMGAEGINCVDGRQIIIAAKGSDYLEAVKRLESDYNLRDSIRNAALTLVIDEYSWPGQLKTLDDILNNAAL